MATTTSMHVADNTRVGTPAFVPSALSCSEMAAGTTTAGPTVTDTKCTRSCVRVSMSAQQPARKNRHANTCARTRKWIPGDTAACMKPAMRPHAQDTSSSMRERSITTVASHMPGARPRSRIPRRSRVIFVTLRLMPARRMITAVATVRRAASQSPGAPAAHKSMSMMHVNGTACGTHTRAWCTQVSGAHRGGPATGRGCCGVPARPRASLRAWEA